MGDELTFYYYLIMYTKMKFNKGGYVLSAVIIITPVSVATISIDIRIHSTRHNIFTNEQKPEAAECRGHQHEPSRDAVTRPSATSYHNKHGPVVPSANDTSDRILLACRLVYREIVRCVTRCTTRKQKSGSMGYMGIVRSFPI